jgi:hypothetical protein
VVRHTWGWNVSVSIHIACSAVSWPVMYKAAAPSCRQTPLC